MQIDSESLVRFSIFSHRLWSVPLKIILTFTILWFYIGWGTFSGLAALLLLFPYIMIISSFMNKTHSKMIEIKDSRIKMINELLKGIKVVKLYGWESSFDKLINKIRNQELKLVGKSSIFLGLLNINFYFFTYLMTIASLLTFIYSDKNNVLTPNVTYVTLALLNGVRFPLFLIGTAASEFVQVLVSMKRIGKFLCLKEIDEKQILYEKNNSNNEAVVFENASFTWDRLNTEITNIHLKNLNFKVHKGKLIAIVSQVGNGKSSLLSSLLCEMNKISGQVKVNGSISYVPQQAWIQNETVRNNILFGREMSQELYDRIVSACELDADLKILPSGDQTEIGEKGINLSGGQKQRVSLARAIYSNSDIYLLDDPLSAVDSHVGKLIFNNVIGPTGLLKNKTRIFVTNSIWFLPQVDEIILLENGSIVEMGSYEDLISSKGPFTDYLQKYSQQNIDQKVNEPFEMSAKTKEINDSDDEIIETGWKIIEAEKVRKGKVHTSMLFVYLKNSSLLLFAAFCLSQIFFNVLGALANFWISDWSDSNTGFKNSTKMSTDSRVLVYSLLGLFQNLFAFVFEIISIGMVINSSRSFHIQILESILHSTMQFFESIPVGRLINRFSKDMNAIESEIPQSFKDTVYCAADVIVTLIVISITTPLSLTALVPIILLYFLVQRFCIASSCKLKRLEAMSKSPVFAHFSETLSGLSTIKAYKEEPRFIELLYEKVDNNSRFIYPSFVSDRWFSLVSEGIGNVIILVATLFAVISRNSISPGLAGLSITLAFTITDMLRNTLMMFSELETNLTSIERITDYSNIPKEAEWVNEKRKPSENWPSFGSIKFHKYSVKYRKDLDFALKDISFEIKPHEKVGIVGRTGAGKSSLSMALFRILESSNGDIIIDDVNIREIGLHDLRHRMTIIPQDPVIFSGPLRFNLDPFDSHSDDELWSALDQVHLKRLVQSLPNKLFFECSEGGENFSVGQRQLLCLARALIRQSRIILLDEATAAIDHKTDELLQETIRSAFKDCTILTIAHRLNTIIDSDRIMVLDQGKLVEFDTLKNLLANTDGVFSSLIGSAGLKVS